MLQNLSDDKSTLVQVMAWCHQATSHYLNQCWPRSPTPYGITRPQWVNTNWLSKVSHVSWSNINLPKMSPLRNSSTDFQKSTQVLKFQIECTCLSGKWILKITCPNVPSTCLKYIKPMQLIWKSEIRSRPSDKSCRYFTCPTVIFTRLRRSDKWNFDPCNLQIPGEGKQKKWAGFQN